MADSDSLIALDVGGLSVWIDGLLLKSPPLRVHLVVESRVGHQIVCPPPSDDSVGSPRYKSATVYSLPHSLFSQALFYRNRGSESHFVIVARCVLSSHLLYSERQSTPIRYMGEIQPGSSRRKAIREFFFFSFYFPPPFRGAVLIIYRKEGFRGPFSSRTVEWKYVIVMVK